MAVGRCQRYLLLGNLQRLQVVTNDTQLLFKFDDFAVFLSFRGRDEKISGFVGQMSIMQIKKTEKEKSHSNHIRVRRFVEFIANSFRVTQIQFIRLDNAYLSALNALSSAFSR